MAGVGAVAPSIFAKKRVKNTTTDKSVYSNNANNRRIAIIYKVVIANQI